MDPAPPATAPARALPGASTLTFLFTDVEGSTPLWERHEATMRAVTARHDALLDAVIIQHGGTRVRERGEGDSLFAVFTRPDEAVAAALAMMRAVLAESWPVETPIRVRMGLHTGAAQLRAGDYYGPVVNRCARIRGLGHGGQVLLSAATATLIREALPEGATLRSLGAHSLKGLSAPEEVYQLCHPALPGEFPPLLSPQAPRHNLPMAMTELIGREAEQGEVLALLATARLVTLVGSGGVGKTRLALAVATELVDQNPEGVWLVELAAIADPALVLGAVAQVLGVREEPGRPLAATLTDHLKDRRLCLILDNCEHLVAACASLAASLLHACPHLRVLATSREALELAGEHRWRVPSLSIPDPRHLPPPELTGSYEAVRLFVARARQRRADFALTPQNARAVAQVCARLDGIPLAIELAAARVGSLGVEGIAARLDDRFRLLTGGARDALPRQRTLRAALDWSYDLLSEQEQMLLDRLSIFAGGWSLPAAEAVGAGDGPEQERLRGSDDLANLAREGPGASDTMPFAPLGKSLDPPSPSSVGQWEVLDLLGSLVNKSLVQVEEQEGGDLRYALLETVRQYGQERLAGTGGAAAVRDRHLGYFLALAEEVQPRLTGPEQGAWLDRLETEHDNLRAAVHWSVQGGGDAALGLRLAAALWRFWYMRGYLSEGRGWLEAALAAGDQGSPAARTRALTGAGVLASLQGDLARAVARFEETLALERGLGNRQRVAYALANLGNVAHMQADYDRAAALFEEAVALERELGDRKGVSNSLSNLGLVAYAQRDLARAVILHGEALALSRELGDQYGVARSLCNLGVVAYDQADLARATTLLEESLALSRELGLKADIAEVLGHLGNVALERGDWRQAAAAHVEGLTLAAGQGNRLHVVAALEGLAQVAAAPENPASDPRRAARLLAAAAALRAALGAPLPPVYQARVERALTAARAALGEDAFAAVWAAGQAPSMDEAVALALAGQTAAAGGA